MVVMVIQPNNVQLCWCISFSVVYINILDYWVRPLVLCHFGSCWSHWNYFQLLCVVLGNDHGL